METRNSYGLSYAAFLLVSAAVILAWHPGQWLVNSWFSPDYESQGLLVFPAVLALFIYSASSPRIARSHSKAPYIILGGTAALRLAAEILAVNSLGALALGLDVWAVARLCGLNLRMRAVSPFWLAALFTLSLPTERIVQRLLGYGLQLFSAEGAVRLIRLFEEGAIREGVAILAGGRDILVDLPCSGARGLVILAALFCFLMAVKRPSFKAALAALGLGLAGAVSGNMLRVAALSLSLLRPETFFGLKLMEQPWHDLTGLVTLALSAAPLLFFVRRLAPSPISPTAFAEAAAPRAIKNTRLAGGLASLALVAAILIVNAPARPLDVDRRTPAEPRLPSRLMGSALELVPLSEQEARYFKNFGGAAVKGGYGPNGLMVVRTSSPLRHLHAPDECLRGLGFTVEYLGRENTVVPSAVYRADAPDGGRWRVAVSFKSSGGSYAASVAEAVWHWLRHPGESWTAVQRLTPWRDDPRPALAWDRVVAAALDF